MEKCTKNEVKDLEGMLKHVYLFKFVYVTLIELLANWLTTENTVLHSVYTS